MTTRPTATSPRRRGRDPSRGWPVPAGLVALSAIPLTAASLRLIQLSGGPEIMPADDRFTGFPTALVVHVTGATAFALLGIGQLVPRMRFRYRAWHRLAGHVVAGWVIRRPLRRGQALDRSSAKTAPEGALP
jgi:hypothetical protein